MKPKKNKKPPKMKRAELLKRLLGFLEHGVIAVSEESQNWINEWLLLKEELRRVVK